VILEDAVKSLFVRTLRPASATPAAGTEDACAAAEGIVAATDAVADAENRLVSASFVLMGAGSKLGRTAAREDVADDANGGVLEDPKELDVGQKGGKVNNPLFESYAGAARVVEELVEER